MLFIYNKNTDPYFNLAAEEFLLNNKTEEIFMLWQNDNAIIIGKNQNTLSEINYEYVTENNISVVRRLSGGGAVYHDMGNINFTFIVNSGEDFSNYSKFSDPIIGFLSQQGISAGLQGRNDIAIDGKKISGNAQYMHKGRLLHHGTLLYSAQTEVLASALCVNEEKIQSKGIKSVRSRVTNINNYLKNPPSAGEFISELSEYILTTGTDFVPYDLSVDTAKIEALADEKYRSWEWNFGYSPRYNFKSNRQFSFGGVSVFLSTGDNSVIETADFYGDFFSKKPVSELACLLCGRAHKPEAIYALLKEINISDYISSMTNEDFISLLF